MKTPYTCLYRRIWDDERFYQMSEIGQNVFFFVISAPNGNGIGCFKAGMAGMAEEARKDPGLFEEGFMEGLRQGLFKYDEKHRVLFIPSYFENNLPSNPNGITALGKEYVKIPECELKAECYQLVKEWVDTKGEGFQQRFTESFPEPFAKPFPEPFKEPFKEPLVEPFKEPFEEPLAHGSRNHQGRITPSPSYSTTPSSYLDLDKRDRVNKKSPELGQPDGSVSANPIPNSTCDSLEPKKQKREKPTEPPTGLTNRQKEFFEALRRCKFHIVKRGLITAWEAVEDPVILAETLGDERAYPAVDVGIVARASGWSIANPQKAKKRIDKFLHNWAAREQERGGSAPSRFPQQQNQPYPHSADLAEKVRNAR